MCDNIGVEEAGTVLIVVLLEFLAEIVHCLDLALEVGAQLFTGFVGILETAVDLFDLPLRESSKIHNSLQLAHAFDLLGHPVHILLELDDELGDHGWDVVPLVGRVSDLRVDHRVLYALPFEAQHESVVVDPFARISGLLLLPSFLLFCHFTSLACFLIMINFAMLFQQRF